MLPIPTYVSALTYIGQVTAFSLCILMIAKFDRTVGLWLMSNVFGSIGMLLVADVVVIPGDNRSWTGVVFLAISSTTKGIALSYGRASWRRNKFAWAAIGFTMMMAAGVKFIADSPYRLIVTSFMGSMLCLSVILFLYKNRRWSGIWGHNLMLGAMSLGSATMFTRMLSAYPLGTETMFFGNSAQQFTLLQSLIVVSFFMQIAMIGMLIGRKERLRLFAERRSTRLIERTLVLNRGRAEVERLASERLNLLKLLTHEVRQPLNNAQAALQTVISELSAKVLQPDRVKEAASRTQAVLDSITLTLSNSIVGASLIEHRKDADFQPLDVISIAELALTDCPTDEQYRITMTSPDETAFLSADPILLRISLRNLLDNALKYSPPGSGIAFEITFDETRFGIAFAVTNIVADENLLKGDLFARNKRGFDNHYEGFGIGLYIVNESARIHHGTLGFTRPRPGIVTFELFLPN